MDPKPSATGDPDLALELPDIDDHVIHEGRVFKVSGMHVRKHRIQDRSGNQRLLLSLEINAYAGSDQWDDGRDLLP